MHHRKLSDSSDEKSKRKNRHKKEATSSSYKKYNMVSSSIDPHRLAGYEGAYGYQKDAHIRRSNEVYRGQRDFDINRYPGSAYYGSGAVNRSKRNLYYDNTSSSSDDNYRSGKYRDLSYGRSYKERAGRVGGGYQQYDDISRSTMFPSYQGYNQAYNQGYRSYGYENAANSAVGQRYIGGVNNANVDVQAIRRDLATSYEVLPPRRAYERGVYGAPLEYSRASDVYRNSSGVIGRGDPLARPLTTSGIYSNEHYLNGSTAPLYDYREYEALSRPNYSAFSAKWQPSGSAVYDNLPRRDRYETGYENYYRGGKIGYDSELDVMERKYRYGAYPPIRDGVLRHSFASNLGAYDPALVINQTGLPPRAGLVYGPQLYAPVGVSGAVGQQMYGAHPAQLISAPSNAIRGTSYAPAPYLGVGGVAQNYGAYY